MRSYLDRMEDSHEPVACTVESSKIALRALNLPDLEGLALSAERIERGAAMTFPAGLEKSLRGLVDQEAQCCRWLSIDVIRAGDEVRLEMTSDNPDGQPIVESLAGVAQQ